MYTVRSLCPFVSLRLCARVCLPFSRASIHVTPLCVALVRLVREFASHSFVLFVTLRRARLFFSPAITTIIIENPFP